MQHVRYPGQIRTDIHRRDRDSERSNKRGHANYDGLGLLAAAAGLGLLHHYGHHRHNHTSTTIPLHTRTRDFFSTTIPLHTRTNNHMSTTVHIRGRNSISNFLGALNRNRSNNIGAIGINLAAMNAVSQSNFNNALNNFNNGSNALRASAAA